MLLTRDIKSPIVTLGKLTIGDMSFYTCEDPVRDKKIAGITAIPTGKYKVIINFSNRFQKPLPLLLDVPNFSGVRIHSGNTPVDTDGCILIGTARNGNSVLNSRFAMSLFQPMLEESLKHGEVWLTIT